MPRDCARIETPIGWVKLEGRLPRKGILTISTWQVPCSTCPPGFYQPRIIISTTRTTRDIFHLNIFCLSLLSCKTATLHTPSPSQVCHPRPILLLAHSCQVSSSPPSSYRTRSTSSQRLSPRLASRTQPVMLAGSYSLPSPCPRSASPLQIPQGQVQPHPRPGKGLSLSCPFRPFTHTPFISTVPGPLNPPSPSNRLISR